MNWFCLNFIDFTKVNEGKLFTLWAYAIVFYGYLKTLLYTTKGKLFTNHLPFIDFIKILQLPVK